MDTIRLTNIIIYSYHGAFEEERRLGQRFEIDVELSLDLRSAAESDRLDACVNYEAVYDIVVKTVTEKKFYLIETVAEHIANNLLVLDVGEVLVRVRKPNVPIKGAIDYVEVELKRQKQSGSKG